MRSRARTSLDQSLSDPLPIPSTPFRFISSCPYFVGVAGRGFVDVYRNGWTGRMRRDVDSLLCCFVRIPMSTFEVCNSVFPLSIHFCSLVSSAVAKRPIIDSMPSEKRKDARKRRKRPLSSPKHVTRRFPHFPPPAVLFLADDPTVLRGPPHRYARITRDVSRDLFHRERTSRDGFDVETGCFTRWTGGGMRGVRENSEEDCGCFVLRIRAELMENDREFN